MRQQVRNTTAHFLQARLAARFLFLEAGSTSLAFLRNYAGFSVVVANELTHNFILPSPSGMFLIKRRKIKGKKTSLAFSSPRSSPAVAPYTYPEES